VKNIIFQSVSIKNFLSIGNNPIEIDFKKGITVITGENKDKGGKNGIGKSTIADAIFWCLFGNTIRELKKDKIQHNRNKEECQVILNFTVSNGKNISPYTITRTLNPAKIEISLESGQRFNDLTLSTIPENDEFIKGLIGANEEVFNNAVVMSANNTIPFMAQKKTEKRKFIEGILQLNIFSEMLLKTRSEYNDIKKQNDIISGNFVNLQRSLATFEDQKTNAEAKKQEKINVLNDKIKDIEKNSKELKNNNLPTTDEINKQIKEVEDKVSTLKIGLKSFKITRSDLATKSSNISAEINQLKKEKQKIVDKGNTCPTCNREYCADDIKEVEQRLKNIDAEISVLCGNSLTVGSEIISWDDKIDKLEEGIEKLNKKIRSLDQIKSETKLISQKLSNNLSNILDCRKSISEIELGDPSIQSNIDKTQNDIEKTEKQLIDIKKTMAILDTAKFIVSEEGVKTFIVKKIINILNTRLNYYLQTLDAPCKCVFDETFEETIYNEQGKECSYFNFSGGERKRIDTAILFTFQDVMRCHSGTSFSLNIYDELFDCALDAKGTDKILEILKDKVEKYNESIYIVSHKSSEVANCDNVILLEKSNGVTKIVS
jgi:DNA repair exonuclease SbcCD ATPase subunit